MLPPPFSFLVKFQLAIRHNELDRLPCCTLTYWVKRQNFLDMNECVCRLVNNGLPTRLSGFQTTARFSRLFGVPVHHRWHTYCTHPSTSQSMYHNLATIKIWLNHLHRFFPLSRPIGESSRPVSGWNAERAGCQVWILGVYPYLFILSQRPFWESKSLRCLHPGCPVFSSHPSVSRSTKTSSKPEWWAGALAFKPNKEQRKPVPSIYFLPPLKYVDPKTTELVRKLQLVRVKHFTTTTNPWFQKSSPE